MFSHHIHAERNVLFSVMSPVFRLVTAYGYSEVHFVHRLASHSWRTDVRYDCLQAGKTSSPSSMRRLSDMPAYGQIDDPLIEPFSALSSSLGDPAVTLSPGAATQGSTSRNSVGYIPESFGALGLAAKLRAKTAQRADGEAAGPPRRDLFQTMIDIVEGDDSIDITNMVSP